jgi:hypothetical protein
MSMSSQPSVAAAQPTGLRESLNKHKGVAVATAVVVVVAAGLLAWRSTTVPEAAGSAAAVQAFYSADDGNSFFAAPADLIPPFEWEGKTACRAAVFTCDGGKTKFVGYLERYPPGAKKQLDAAQQALKAGAKGAGPSPMAASSVEVKKPGAPNKWVPRHSREAAGVLNVTPPAGAPAASTPQMVTPQ